MKKSNSQLSSVIADTVDSLKHRPGALLPILHEIQNSLGYVPQEAVPVIAEKLNLSRAEVHGVISFYHHFATQPRGRHVIEVCRAESCQAVGGREIESFAKEKLGIDYHQTTPDQQFTLEPVYCLGNCACSPSVRVGKQIFGRMTAERFDQLVEDLGTVPLEIS